MQVGTYSCHGVEPSYNGGGDDDEGVTAKINQDRGCVVYPFNGDAKHALFSVFDGEGCRVCLSHGREESIRV